MRCVKGYCNLYSPFCYTGRQLLKMTMERLGLSARAYDRLLKVALTIADLAGTDGIEINHLAEAI